MLQKAVLSFCFLFLISPKVAFSEKERLISVHAIFRHGDRTNDAKSIYPKDPYKNVTYYPYGLGQLTNKGKMREYELGQFLRKRYDKFLGKWVPQTSDLLSTNVDRTKASLEMVLAGLFAPQGNRVWNENLLWQPIPYQYEKSNDKFLSGIIKCPNFGKHMNQYIEKHEDNLKNDSQVFEYLSKHTGWNVGLNESFYLYFGLTCEQEWGLNLPQWTQKVYPGILRELVIKMYMIETGNIELKKIASGYLLEKIVRDTKAQIGAFYTKTNKTKMFLYSAHEYNIAHLLNTLDIYDKTIPPYGSCVLLEVVQNFGTYGIKIYYYAGPNKEPKLLKLRNCGTFCPLEKWIALVDEYLPDESSCGDNSEKKLIN